MPLNILIADDYDDNRELLRLILANAGHNILEARDGEEALVVALGAAPDVALVDLSMPSLDGWALLKELRADPRTRSIPCIAVTAFAGDQHRQRALEAGFDAYLSKPFRAKDLLDMVHDLAARRGTRPDPDASM